MIGFIRTALFTVGFAIVLLSSLLTAQSTISGVVADPSGAVMPGVSVEAASPALIEKSCTVTTDGGGRYATFDVRPGQYTLTFTASGFSTVKRANVDVPSNVTVNVGADMKVGTVGETVEVAETTPVVDVENVAHPQVLSRSDMDALPAARYMQSMGSYVPGVHLNVPDIGGSQQVEQNYLSAHGNSPTHSTYLLDGMSPLPESCACYCNSCSDKPGVRPPGRRRVTRTGKPVNRRFSFRQ